MTVRKRSDTGVWLYEFMVRGVRYYGSFPQAEDRIEAEALEAVERLKAHRGEWRKGPDVTTFGAFVERYFVPYSKTKVSWSTDEYRLERITRRFGHLPVAAITPELLGEYARAQLKTRSRRGQYYSPSTVKKLMNLFSAILQMAVTEGLVSFNAARLLNKGVKRLLVESPNRDRFLDADEEGRLFNTFAGRRAHLGPLTRAAILTGMRKGELLSLEPRHVNMGETPITFKLDTGKKIVPPGWLLVERSKNGLARPIPLSGRARELFDLLLGSCGDHVFSSPWSDGPLAQIQHGFTSAVEDAGIQDFHFHDLRHTFATRALDAGANVVAVRDILGHKPKDMTGRYTHATHESMVEAVELVARHGRTGEDSGRVTVLREVV